jgi:cleavage and polyadenylation specificity factor subunit 1
MGVSIEQVACFILLILERFEFATNEFINAMACVTLETTSTETGSKDYIAVGTTINRGEDLAAKGTVSISSFCLRLVSIYWNI